MVSRKTTYANAGGGYWKDFTVDFILFVSKYVRPCPNMLGYIQTDRSLLLGYGALLSRQMAGIFYMHHTDMISMALTLAYQKNIHIFLKKLKCSRTHYRWKYRLSSDWNRRYDIFRERRRIIFYRKLGTRKGWRHLSRQEQEILVYRKRWVLWHHTRKWIEISNIYKSFHVDDLT